MGTLLHAHLWHFWHVGTSARRHLVWMLIAALCGADGTVGQGADDINLPISIDAGSLRPGGVVLLTVAPSSPVASVGGEALGRTLDFWPAADSTAWQTIVGIPIGTAAVPHQFRVQATASDGTTISQTGRLDIAPAHFAARRLRVNPRFVNPPKSAAARIARESKVLAEIFAKVTPDRLWKGPFIAPVPGEATSSFGRLTILNGKEGSRHLGADFRAKEGTPVNAPNAGAVVLVDDLYFSGNTVILDHGGGLYSLFGHLSQIAVAVGARVARGEAIGESGASGRVTGPHLHWAVRLRDDSVDPLSLMEAVADLSE